MIGRDFMRFRLKADDKLSYDQKINVSVCVILISSVFEKGDWYYPQIELQECFYKVIITQKNRNSLKRKESEISKLLH